MLWGIREVFTAMAPGSFLVPAELETIKTRPGEKEDRKSLHAV